MFTIQNKDGSRSYTITRHARVGGISGTYFIWCLSEMSDRNDEGYFMRSRLVAQFGNTANKQSYKDAKNCAIALARL